MAEVCLFCGENLYQDKWPVSAVSKGDQTITDKNLQYDDGLRTKLKDCPSVIVHTGCRKSYTRPGSPKKPASKDNVYAHPCDRSNLRLTAYSVMKKL